MKKNDLRYDILKAYLHRIAHLLLAYELRNMNDLLAQVRLRQNALECLNAGTEKNAIIKNITVVSLYYSALKKAYTYFLNLIVQQKKYMIDKEKQVKQNDTLKQSFMLLREYIADEKIEEECADLIYSSDKLSKIIFLHGNDSQWKKEKCLDILVSCSDEIRTIINSLKTIQEHLVMIKEDTHA